MRGGVDIPGATAFLALNAVCRRQRRQRPLHDDLKAQIGQVSTLYYLGVVKYILTIIIVVLDFKNTKEMDFAPYQDTAPETTRALSPPPNRPTSPPVRNVRSPPPIRPTTDPFRASSLPAPDQFSDEPRRNAGFGGGDIENGRLDVNLFETSLPLRLDYEACLAYLLLPPAGGVFLLLVEHKSDYVRYVLAEIRIISNLTASPSRFHAWQSSLTFSAIFVIHLIFSWSSVLSWMLFVGDLGLIGLLTLHAYQDGLYIAVRCS